MKVNNKKGFTLAELLIVVAIIGVLIAIALPTFTTQLNKAKQATAAANARSVYSEYVATCLSNSTVPTLDELKTELGKMTANEKQGATIEADANIITVTLGSLDAIVIETDIAS